VPTGPRTAANFETWGRRQLDHEIGHADMSMLHKKFGGGEWIAGSTDEERDR